MAFTGFGEAARLYAENAALVDRMRETMIENIDSFLSDLRQGVEEELSRSVAESRVPGGKWSWRRWFLSDDATGHESHPKIWFYDQDPEIVVPGMLWLTVSVPKDKHEQYAAVRNELSFAHEKGDEGGLFSFEVRCDSEDPISQATSPIAEVLGALRAAEVGR